MIRKSRAFCILLLGIIILGNLCIACNKMNPPKNPVEEERNKVIKNKGRLVMDLASPTNMTFAIIEGVCLIEGLPDTGADEPPSHYQEMILEELQRDIDQKKTARQKIASMTTAIGMVKVIVPPGARKGDHLDVEISLIPKSTATSIEGGYIANTRLYQYLTADYIRKGALNGIASGRILLDPDLLERNDPIAYQKGIIIGGATIVRPRDIWLTIREEERSAGIAQRMEDVINNRFSYKLNGSKRKVAEAKYGAARINLVVPEEYRDNVNRYVNVVSNIAFFETPDELQRRLEELKVKLLSPETSEFASFQLEAIGPNNPLVVEAVAAGLNHPNETIRYHSAICMAYLNVAQYRSQTAKILGELAKENAIFRPSCLAVLGTCLKTSFEADQVLRELLSVNSQETRYGAFRALWTRNPQDYMIQGEKLGEQFSYHCLNCDGPPMIHVTRSKRPEIVLFSKSSLYLTGNFEADAGKRIVVRGEDNRVIVKHYKSGVDEERAVDNSLDSIIRAIVDVGGTYPNIVQFLVEAKKKDLLKAESNGEIVSAPLVFDALPGANGSKFKKIRDITAIQEEIDAAKEEAQRKEKKSFWNRMNPVSLFKKDKEEEPEDFSGTFEDMEEGEDDAEVLLESHPLEDNENEK